MWSATFTRALILTFLPLHFDLSALSNTHLYPSDTQKHAREVPARRPRVVARCRYPSAIDPPADTLQSVCLSLHFGLKVQENRLFWRLQTVHYLTLHNARKTRYNTRFTLSATRFLAFFSDFRTFRGVFRAFSQTESPRPGSIQCVVVK